MRTGIIANSKKIIWFFLKNFIRLFPVSKAQNRVAFIKNDGIGDYILIRNFFPYLKKSPEFQSKKLIFIGSPSCRDFVLHFDKKYFDEFIWIEHKKYKINLLYRAKKILQIRKLNLDLIVNLVHSRTAMHDEIALLSSAREKRTTSGDNNNLPAEFKLENDRRYDVVFPVINNLNFEFFRNKDLFEKILNTKINLTSTSLNIQKNKSLNVISVFPGATIAERRWSPQNFAKLIELIHKKHPEFQFRILGSKSDQVRGKTILNALPETVKCRDLCGKTTVIELAEKIAESHFLISNETAAPHIAAALNIPTVCVANGERFGRFSPYPENMTDCISYVFPNQDFYDVDKMSELILKYENGSDLDINGITPNRVFEVFEKFIKNITS